MSDMSFEAWSLEFSAAWKRLACTYLNGRRDGVAHKTVKRRPSEFHRGAGSANPMLEARTVVKAELPSYTSSQVCAEAAPAGSSPFDVRYALLRTSLLTCETLPVEDALLHSPQH